MSRRASRFARLVGVVGTAGAPVVRLVALATIVAAGCTVARGTVPSTPVTPHAPEATAAPTVGASGAAPGAASSADDEALARLITAGAERAIPQLKSLNDSDPSRLEQLFEPLGAWIAEQRTDVADSTPSGCTADAVTAYLDGLDRYDAIRKKFLAWRDWGALGNAFPPGAPREAGDAFRTALTELASHCHA